MLRKSCLTGRVVWLCQGKSWAAGMQAYQRARQREVERVKRWGVTVKRRMANIRRLLNDCTSGIPITATPTTEQKAAIRLLETMSKESVACHRDFYEHVVATRRRRKEDRRDRKETKNKN